MYIDDTCRPTDSDVVELRNVGSHELVSINWLIDTVEKIAGVTLERDYNLDAPRGLRGRNSDNALIRDKLGWVPSVRLKDGMGRTQAWICDRMTG